MAIISQSYGPLKMSKTVTHKRKTLRLGSKGHVQGTKQELSSPVITELSQETERAYIFGPEKALTLIGWTKTSKAMQL